MSKVKCPGQDTRYWKPGDIFILACGKCGKVVEFFKDDVSRKCPECGSRIQNPKITLGCAQWCEHAAECLGYDPKAAISESNGSGSEKSVINKILDEIGTRFGKQSVMYRNAESSLNKAGRMMKRETADPKIVFPAVLIIGADAATPDILSRKNDLLPVSREILNSACLDKATIDDICELVSAFLKGETIESSEFTIVSECGKSLKLKGLN